MENPDLEISAPEGVMLTGVKVKMVPINKLASFVQRTRLGAWINRKIGFTLKAEWIELRRKATGNEAL